MAGGIIAECSGNTYQSGRVFGHLLEFMALLGSQHLDWGRHKINSGKLKQEPTTQNRLYSSDQNL